MITHSYVRVMIDAMQLMQSKEFVATTDITYPEMLLKVYSSEQKKIEALRKTIFQNVGEKGDDLPLFWKYGVQFE